MRRRTVTVAILAGSAVAVASGVVLSRRLADSSRHAIADDSIVVLGDSITAQGDWQALLPHRPVVNRGYAGYTTEQLIPVAREVADAGPRAVFVLTGTNDIRDARPPDWTAQHLTTILDTFAAQAPSTDVVLQTLLPRADAVDQVAAVNDEIRLLAIDRGLRLLDLHPAFDDGSGGLRPTETSDGVHLTPAGYARWAAVLEPVLAELDARPVDQSANE